MGTVKLSKKLPLPALPICLVGSNVDGKANFCTVAWFTVIDDEPPVVGLVMAKKRRTKDGMAENGTFSVNIPSTGQVAETDYCGLVSGAKVDKSSVFNVRYGELRTAPMIEGAPITMECKLKQIVEFEGTDLVIGEVVDAYADESIMKGGKPDLKLIDPLLYSMSSGQYFSLGHEVAQAFSIGKKLMR
jgi:flavin reductase (DIM6/NTAB) family NADH-FMN oxidoreductase RutF